MISLMTYHGLPLQPMQESGAFLLRAMQNEDMPRLDLMVRESVQNALDAALDRKPGGQVHVDFRLREHSTDTVASLFSDGLDLGVLRARYPAGGRLLEIRDSRTEGLTGPLSFEDLGEGGPHGNLLKLVFEIGRTRSDDGAGGSWGLGKTCYFRMGAGFVIYYSRIRLDNGYQERLVATLVEDETRDDRLQKHTRTGIGWWGSSRGRQPITGTLQVRQVLDMLRVAPFEGTETGTAIIIPFVRDDLIAQERDDNDAPVRRAWWCDSYEAYIRVALERWFCARLDNPLFATGPWLAAAVNGQGISRRTMLPVFRVTQALYNRAVHDAPANDDYLALAKVSNDSILRKPISPRSVFAAVGPAGHVSAALLTPEHLGMGEPDNGPDPGMCVLGRSDVTPPFRPLVTFMRRPGMCVSWEDSTESRGWAGGLPGVPDGRYLIAVFVPRHDQVLAESGRRAAAAAPVSLESYLRSCERADHAAWHDISGLKVVEKIRLNCGKHLREFGGRVAPTAAVAQSIRMARNLADLVLPERGMGTDGRTGRKSPTCSSGGGGQGRRSSSPAPVLDVLAIRHGKRGMEVDWSLVWGTADRSVPRQITVRVDSESGSVSAQEWREDGLGTFPFRVVDGSLASSPAGDRELVALGGDGAGGALLRPVSGAAVEIVQGTVVVGFATEAARSLRAVLSVGLAVPAKVRA